MLTEFRKTSVFSWVISVTAGSRYFPRKWSQDGSTIYTTTAKQHEWIFCNLSFWVEWALGSTVHVFFTGIFSWAKKNKKNVSIGKTSQLSNPIGQFHPSRSEVKLPMANDSPHGTTPQGSAGSYRFGWWWNAAYKSPWMTSPSSEVDWIGLVRLHPTT